MLSTGQTERTTECAERCQISSRGATKRNVCGKDVGEEKRGGWETISRGRHLQCRSVTLDLSIKLAINVFSGYCIRKDR